MEKKKYNKKAYDKLYYPIWYAKNKVEVQKRRKQKMRETFLAEFREL